MKAPAYGALPLGNSGRVAIVDLADWFRLCRYRWYVRKEGYVFRTRTVAGRPHRQQLTHDVLGLSRHQHVAFVNGDSLDCRRINLRLPLGNIYYYKRSRRAPFRVRIGVDGVLHEVGGWPTLKLAQEAREAAARVAAQLRGRGLSRKQVQRQLDLATGRKVGPAPVPVQQERVRAA